MMICTHCGKVLKDYDKFCSNCGAVIEQEEEKEFVFTAPERDFEWNVHSFPDGIPHKTEDIDFDWGIKEGEFKRRPVVDETTFQTPVVAPVPGVEQMQEIDAEPVAPMPEMEQQMPEMPVPEMTQPEPVAPMPEVEQQIPEMPVPEMTQPMPENETEKSKSKKGFFSRFTREKYETAENPVITDEMIQEGTPDLAPEVPVTPEPITPEPTTPEPVSQEPVEEPIYKAEHVQFDWTQSMDPHQEFMAMVEKQERETADQMPHISELKDEKEDDIKGEKLEKELFGGAAVAGVVDGGEGLSRHSAKIDKFYTFNKKNEEFQKLLDNEYERFREGRPMDNDTFSANVEAIRASAENVEGGEISDHVSDRVSGLDEIESINDTIRVEPFDKYDDNRRTIPYHIVSGDEDLMRMEQPAADNDPVQPEPENDLPQYPRQATMPQFAIDPEPEMVPGLERLPEMEKTQDEIDQEKLEKIKEIFGMEQQPQNDQAQQPQGQMFYDGQPQSFQPQPAQSMTAEQQPQQQFQNIGAQPQSQQFQNAGAQPQSQQFQNAGAQPQSQQFQNAGAQPQSQQFRQVNMEQAQQKAQDTSGYETAGQEQKGAQYQSVFDDEKKAKSGKAGKIAIVVLSVILALLVIALGLKLIAPDSILSQKIDNMADSVMEFFKGENDTASSERMNNEKSSAVTNDSTIYSAVINTGTENPETKTMKIRI